MPTGIPGAGPKAHPATLSDEELLRDVQLRAVRRSGPGGQHRNKVETGIVLEHLPTGLRAEASERRSQSANRRVALFRLRLLLAVEYRWKDRPAGNSELWQSRCRKGRLSVSRTHEDFPALLAETLDRLSELEFDVRQAADLLQCRSSQLIRFLKLDSRALAEINRIRVDRGQHRLK